MSALRNHICDVRQIHVGSAHDASICSGVTVVLPTRPCIAAVDVRGGGTGTRETEALGLAGTVDEVHGVVLAGGSAFGLAAATAVQAWLAERRIGFNIGGACVPIVAQAILFDLLNGGNKSWGESNPYERLARAACDDASGEATEIGSVGAGFGATTANLRGGLGSASAWVSDGVMVGALVAVNAVGCVTMGDSPHFWAWPFEQNKEFGGRGPLASHQNAAQPLLKGGPGQNTTIAVVATNARLDKRQTHRLAVMAQTGLARAIHPVHTPLDGDLVFAMATGEIELKDPLIGLTSLGCVAGDVLARAVARGVYSAAAPPSRWQGPQSYRERFGAEPTDK